MERYSFFDPQLVDGQPDREYNAEEFTDYFNTLVTTGIMQGAGNELAVSVTGSNMISTVDTGIAFINGRYYHNDSPLNLQHDTESLGVDRIDRIVVRRDLNTSARYVRSFVKKGVASTNPQPPSLQRDDLIYEISLAQVLIVGGQTYIDAGNVTDERLDENVCGYAGSNILPNFDDAALNDLITDFNNHLTATMPHQFSDGTSTYRYGFKTNAAKDGLIFIYEEVL